MTTNPIVTSITEDAVEVQIGPNGFSIPTSNLRDLVLNADEITRIAAGLRAANTDMSDLEAIESAIESLTFTI